MSAFCRSPEPLGISASWARPSEPGGPASALRRLRRRAAAALGLGVRPPPAFGSEAVWAARGEVVWMTRGAGRALGRACRIGACEQDLVAALSGDDAERRAAVEALIRRGRAFRLTATLPDHRLYDVEGAPDGPTARITLRDVTDEAETLARLREERDAARRETEAMRAALETLGAKVWLRDQEGGDLWRSAPALGDEPKPDAVGRDLAGGRRLLVAPLEASEDAARRRLADILRETFAHLPVGLAVFGADRRLQIANPAIAEMFGPDDGWLSERPTLREALDRLREARRLPEQANYPAWRASLFTLFDDPSRAAFEDVWDLPDGRSIQVLARPFPGDGVAFLFEDVTEAIALQRWRATAVEVRRATLDMLAEGVAVFGADGRVRILNPAFLALWRLGGADWVRPSHIADLAERCAGDAAAAELWTRVRATVARDAGRSAWRGRVALSDGRVLLARVAPMPDGSTLAAFSDVTDSERMADALRERAELVEAAEEMRDALMDQLSHQLRTPLNAVFGFSDMLLSDERIGSLSDGQRDYVAAIRDAAHALNDGVENLADLATLHPGAAPMTECETPIAPAVRSAAQLLARRMQDRGGALDLDRIDDDAALVGDPARLRQMVFNLLSAASAACEPGDRLEVALSTNGESVALRCAGRSCGRAAEQPGFGLARRAAELHGGSIEASSSNGAAPALVARLPLRRADGAS